MATFKEKGDEWEDKLESFSQFKIGKTGQTIKERYKEEYSDTYTMYDTIGHSNESNVIDNFEKYMIERFMDLENCDNEQIGGGEMTKSDRYIVYVMYNE